MQQKITRQNYQVIGALLYLHPAYTLASVALFQMLDIYKIVTVPVSNTVSHLPPTIVLPLEEIIIIMRKPYQTTVLQLHIKYNITNRVDTLD